MPGLSRFGTVEFEVVELEVGSNSPVVGAVWDFGVGVSFTVYGCVTKQATACI